MAIAVSIGTFVATLVGGLFALHLRDRLHLILGFSAGALIGVASTLMLRFQEDVLALCLALFAGFFLYIGASDLLPESYHGHPTAGTTAMTIIDVLTLYAAVRLANL